jgi:hypothetical protein
MEHEHMKSIVESLLLAREEPRTMQRSGEALEDLDAKDNQYGT